MTKTESGESSIVAEFEIPADDMFLRIEREGDNWRFCFRTEPIQSWIPLTTVPMPLRGHDGGMGVKTLDLFPHLYGPGEAFFDYFMISK